MCRVLAGQYPPAPESVGDARRWTERILTRWELDRDAVADSMLLTSELVTNAVLHARSPVVVSLAVADGVLEVGVGDEDPRPPRRRAATVPRPAAGVAEPTSGWWPWPAGTAAESGRGLMLLDEVADEWGVASLVTGKQVWFRLDARDYWPYRTACPCAAEDLGRVRLESGRQVLAVTGPWDDDQPDPAGR